MRPSLCLDLVQSAATTPYSLEHLHIYTTITDDILHCVIDT